MQDQFHLITVKWDDPILCSAASGGSKEETPAGKEERPGGKDTPPVPSHPKVLAAQ